MPAPPVVAAGRPQRICFLFIGQIHHVLHGLEIAIALARRPGFQVEIRVSSRQLLDQIAEWLPKEGLVPRVRMIGSPILRWIAAARGTETPAKSLTLLRARRELNGYDVIVVPERTSTALRRFGVDRPKLVHVDHGAGDRAIGYEARIALFDLVLVAGEKQRARMLRSGIVRPDGHAVIGYPKFEAADRIRRAEPYPFASRKPVILYNPHFDGELGSWPEWGSQIIANIVASRQFNLIFAPHLRLFDTARARQRAMRLLEPCIGRPDVHIDLGSARSADMSYTEMADIYLGDASSQVYEFLRKPRPCVFLNPRRQAWEDDENYAHWRFGQVITDPSHVVAALNQASADHARYRPVQACGFARTFDRATEAPSERAASVIARFCALRTL